jgi:hypothetical protein
MKIQKGDTIRFWALCFWGVEKGPRKVRKIRDSGSVEVRCNGWNDFVIKQNEITHINGLKVAN